MKKLFLLLLLLPVMMLLACNDDSSDREFVEAAVDIMDTYGLFATGTSWENAKAEALASNPETFEEAQAIVRKALKVAGGKHSFLRVNIQNSSSQSATPQPAQMPTVINRDDNILVVKLPPFSSGTQEGKQYAQTVLDAIQPNLRGAVIDLRQNTGGSMYPMLAAVHRFFPDEEVFYFKYRDNSTFAVTANKIVTMVELERQNYISCPVAILVDSHTASAAEMVLLAFQGLDNVRTFGTNSAGYSSGNRGFDLPKNTTLALTTSSVITRNGEEFCNNYIEPNVRTSTPLENAIYWINQQ